MPVDYPDALDYEASDWTDADWESDFSEVRRRPGPVMRPAPYTHSAPAKGYVTQAAFQSALDKVRHDVAGNARAIAAVGTHLDALSKRTRSEVKALRDQATRHREETANTLQMLAILPMLSTGGTATVLNTDGKQISVAEPPNTMAQVLPLLMLSGFGGGAGGGGGGGGTGSGTGMDMGMLLAVAVLAGNSSKNA